MTTYTKCPNCRRKLDVAYIEGEGGGGICPTCDFVPRQDFDAAGRQNGHTPRVDVAEPAPEGGRHFLDGRAVLVMLASVEREEVTWLWGRRIPRGRLTALTGDPGVGKSWLSLAVVTAVTVGAPLPGDTEPRKPARVLLLTAEDGLADTVRPRAEDMGADLNKIAVLTAVRDLEGKERYPDLNEHLPAIEAELAQGGYELVVIDPLNAFLGSDLDTHRDAALRSVLGPLAQLAEQHRVAILFVLHLNKGKRDRAIYRATGGIGYVAAARVVLLAGEDPQNPGSRALVWLKGNLSEPAKSISYEIREGRFAWTGESTLTAAHLLAPDPEAGERSASVEAQDFLLDILANGPVEANQVLKEKPFGVSERTLRGVKQTLGIKAERQGEPGKRGGGVWYWSLADAVKAAKTASIRDVAVLTDFVSSNGAKSTGDCSLNDPSRCRVCGCKLSVLAVGDRCGRCAARGKAAVP